MKCSKCGSELLDGVKFCRECGASVEPLKNRFCRKCGAEFTDGDRFCSICGARTELDTETTAVIHTNESTAHENWSQTKIEKKDSDDILSQVGSVVTEKVADVKNRIMEKARSFSMNVSESSSLFARTADGTPHTVSERNENSNKKIILIIVIAIVVLAVIVFSVSGKHSKIAGKIKTNALSNNEVTIEVIDVTGQTYPDALQVLKEAGFTNVVSNIEEGLDETLWVVTMQSISAGESISADDMIELTCAMKCKLYLDIISEFNLLFSTYDISISLDGQEVGSVSNGCEFTYLAEILSGEHELVFCKSGNTSPKGTKKITVSNDITYSCKLSHSGSSISMKDENIEDNVKGATLEVVDVTWMVLSEALDILGDIGFTNLREEPFGSIWDRDNWIVTSQGLEAGTIADKNEFIQLDCISLDDYFSNNYVGKNINEIQKLAEEYGFSVRFEDSSYGDLNSNVDTMDETTKENWIAISARQYGGADKTAVVIIQNTEEIVEETETDIQSKGDNQKYDIDKNLSVTECERDTDKTTMYHITFAECDSDGNPIKYYTFGNIINPREMGDNFNAIGDLPSWFYVGAVVHVKANLTGETLSHCTVSQATEENNNQSSDTENKTESSMPVMVGTSLDAVIEAAKGYGLSRQFSDESFGHGTKMCSLASSNGGLTLDIIYCTSTKEVLCGSIVTFNNLASASEQKLFIKAMASILCPEADKTDVVNWVNSNVGLSSETTIGGFVYEVGLGPTGNILYYAGERNWEKWSVSLS